MKIIYLLNKWFNNEPIPKTIVYGNDLFYWNENLQDYTTSLEPNVIDSNTYFMEQLSFGRLNDEVEILEEQKKIPEKLPKWATTREDKEYTNQEAHILVVSQKINEIIDYLKNKGE